jgi:hypothetical protein
MTRVRVDMTLEKRDDNGNLIETITSSEIVELSDDQVEELRQTQAALAQPTEEVRP